MCGSDGVALQGYTKTCVYPCYATLAGTYTRSPLAHPPLFWQSLQEEAKDESVSHGVTLTEAIAICHTEDAVNAGIKRGDIMVKNTFYYFRRHTKTHTGLTSTEETGTLEQESQGSKLNIPKTLEV